jgi:hypothetical protein
MGEKLILHQHSLYFLGAPMLNLRKMSHLDVFEVCIDGNLLDD